MYHPPQEKYWSYDPHRSRDSLSPVCGIFCYLIRKNGKPNFCQDYGFLEKSLKVLEHATDANLEVGNVLQPPMIAAEIPAV